MRGEAHFGMTCICPYSHLVASVQVSVVSAVELRPLRLNVNNAALVSGSGFYYQSNISMLRPGNIIALYVCI